MPTQPYKDSAGKKLPGVTTFLKQLGWSGPGLMHWAHSQGVAGKSLYEKTAANIGTHAHAMIESDIKKQGFPVKPEGYPQEDWAQAEKCFDAYLDWKRMTKVEVIASEIALVDDGLGYGGCIDAIGLIDGKPCLLDWKTGGTYPDHLAQIVAYARLWEKHNPTLLLTGGYHLLRVTKAGDFAHHHYRADSLEDAWTVFKCCLQLHPLQALLKKRV